MSTVNKVLAFQTLNTFADSRVALIKGMRDAGYTLETARGVVIEWACGKVGSGIKGFKVNDETGKVSLITSHAKYEKAKTTVRDTMLMMAGTTRRQSSGSKEVDLVAEALKAYGKLNAAQKRKFLASV